MHFKYHLLNVPWALHLCHPSRKVTYSACLKEVFLQLVATTSSSFHHTTRLAQCNVLNPAPCVHWCHGRTWTYMESMPTFAIPMLGLYCDMAVLGRHWWSVHCYNVDSCCVQLQIFISAMIWVGQRLYLPCTLLSFIWQAWMGLTNTVECWSLDKLLRREGRLTQWRGFSRL